jgi:hypothetical protein
MNDTTILLSDLLALRDGEPVDLAVARAIEADPALRERLARLRAIKAGLRDLPPVEPDPDLWAQIETRAPRGERRFRVPFPLATAAGVFLATAIGIIALVPNGTAPGGATSEPQIAGLMQRSRSLEAQVSLPNPQVGWNSSQEALMYRLADLDLQLAALQESREGGAGAAGMNREEAELWAKRVQLLEDLREVQRGQARLRPAVL